MASTSEAHIVGLVVRAHPESVDRVTRSLRNVAGAQVHVATSDGRCVVTIEAAHAEEIADRVCRIQTMEGVLAAALVYQHAEAATAMDEEVEL
jgi:nitrate reductase NapD